MAEKLYKITEKQLEDAIRAAHNNGFWQGYQTAIEDWKKASKQMEFLMFEARKNGR